MDSSGVPFATASDYILSLPALPEAVAAQLRAFSREGSTLPLVVLVLVFQRRIISGLTAGALKG